MSSGFMKYEKMASGSTAKIKLDRVPERDWIVTEKIHGSNFSFEVSSRPTSGDGAGAGSGAGGGAGAGGGSGAGAGDAPADVTVRFAKRTSYIEVTDKSFFPGWVEVARAVEPAVVKAFHHIRTSVPDCDAVHTAVVYGELYGGKYVHPDVPAVHSRPIQNGIWYHPALQFAAFDIAVVDDAARRFLDFDHMSTVLKEVEITQVPVLHRGSRAEAFSYEIPFSSQVPAMHSLPPLSAPNYAEGVVVRHAKESTVRGKRLLVKRKIPQFDEVKYSSAQKPSKRESAADAARYDPVNARLVTAAKAHITMARLEAALSKVGPIDAGANRRTILKELCADAIESMWGTDDLLEDMMAGGDLVTGSRPGCLLWEVMAEQGQSLMAEREEAIKADLKK